MTKCIIIKEKSKYEDNILNANTYPYTNISLAIKFIQDWSKSKCNGTDLCKLNQNSTLNELISLGRIKYDYGVYEYSLIIEETKLNFESSK